MRDGLCFEHPPSNRHRQLTPVLHVDGTSSLAPRWHVFEKKVLRFFAVVEDEILESRDEKIRATHVELLYYLEDDTISIKASKLDSPGNTNGVLLKRHRIESLGLHDLNIGDRVVIYGRSYEIVGADAFTVNHLISNGVFREHALHSRPEERVPSDGPLCPISQGSDSVKSGFAMMKASQFLAYDGKVLRFFAYGSTATEIRRFIILYFLADDTLEVRELCSLNSGRDQASVWFRRGKVGHDGQAISRSFHEPIASSFFDIKRVRIGSTVNLLCSPFHVVDADKFTREWFRGRFGIDLGGKVDFPVISKSPESKTGEKEESSRTRDYSSILPSCDIDRLVLRCHCRFDDPPAEDADRRFIISFSLLDSQVSIFEPHVKNSGIIGGRFLEKGSYTNTLSGKPILPEDLHEGNRIGILGRIFEIQECDRFTETFLSRLPELHACPPETVTRRDCVPHRTMDPSKLDELMRTRNGFDVKLLKELSSLTKGDSNASISDLDKALKNIGFTVRMDELVRVSSSLMNSTGDSFNIFDLIHMLKRTKRSV